MKEVISAGGVIVNEFNEVVIVFTDTKSWQFPKGTVETEEVHLDAAIREVEEETGLIELTYIKKLPKYFRISTHEKDTKRYIQYFLLFTKKQLLQPNAEVKYCKWIPLNKIEKHLTYPEDQKFILDTKERIRRAIATYQDT